MVLYWFDPVGRVRNHCLRHIQFVAICLLSTKALRTAIMSVHEIKDTTAPVYTSCDSQGNIL